MILFESNLDRTYKVELKIQTHIFDGEDSELASQLKNSISSDSIKFDFADDGLSNIIFDTNFNNEFISNVQKIMEIFKTNEDTCHIELELVKTHDFSRREIDWIHSNAIFYFTQIKETFENSVIKYLGDTSQLIIDFELPTFENLIIGMDYGNLSLSLLTLYRKNDYLNNSTFVCDKRIDPINIPSFINVLKNTKKVLSFFDKCSIKNEINGVSKNNFLEMLSQHYSKHHKYQNDNNLNLEKIINNFENLETNPKLFYQILERDELRELYFESIPTQLLKYWNPFMEYGYEEIRNNPSIKDSFSHFIYSFIMKYGLSINNSTDSLKMFRYLNEEDLNNIPIRQIEMVLDVISFPEMLVKLNRFTDYDSSILNKIIKEPMFDIKKLFIDNPTPPMVSIISQYFSDAIIYGNMIPRDEENLKLLSELAKTNKAWAKCYMSIIVISIRQRKNISNIIGYFYNIPRFYIGSILTKIYYSDNIDEYEQAKQILIQNENLTTQEAKKIDKKLQGSSSTYSFDV